jgi:Xaa-Pro dipeptidase
VTSQLDEIAIALQHAQLDGWLFYDFRLCDPLAYRILGLSEDGIATRRWFCYVPARGKPRAIVSAVEAHRLDALAVEKIVYRSHDEMIAALRKVLEGARRIAMDYSPACAIPYVSHVDAGTIEIVRAIGVEVVTAADLIQRFEATLTREQLASHQRAAHALRTIVDETFSEIAQLVSAERPVSEVSVQDSVMARFAARGLLTHAPPIVAVNEHSADPHYGPTAKHDRAIRRGDFILLDLWAKEAAAESIYADFTWVAFAGDRIPDEHARVFRIVADARDATVDLVQRRVAAGDVVSGREADRAARSAIEAAGFGDAFVHRTGHSIGREVHGTGANLDSLEMLDDRTLIDNTCFSVEPGIYLPGKFGVRSELDMTIENGRAMVSGEPRQREIVPILMRPLN